jgi:hypothetical protein
LYSIVDLKNGHRRQDRVSYSQESIGSILWGRYRRWVKLWSTSGESDMVDIRQRVLSYEPELQLLKLLASLPGRESKWSYAEVR